VCALALGMSLKSDCIFCKIINGKIPSEIIYRDDNVIGFKDISPSAPLHYIFVPTEHIDSLAKIEENNIHFLTKIFSAILKITKQEGISEQGYRTVINTGKQGGQTVFHLHVHLLAKQNMSHTFA
jgi:histidine triad (HIT) family protein